MVDKNIVNIEADAKTEVKQPALVTPPMALRRSDLTTSPHQIFSSSANLLLLAEDGEPQCYSEVVQMDDSVYWEQAIEDEMSSLNKNET